MKFDQRFLGRETQIYHWFFEIFESDFSQKLSVVIPIPIPFGTGISISLSDSSAYNTRYESITHWWYMHL